jgi:hypothetical protein
MMDQLGHRELDFSYDSLRLVRATVPEEPVAFSFQHRPFAYRLAWRRTDDGRKIDHYYLYFDIHGRGETKRLTPPAFIGVGDALEFGRAEVKDYAGWGLWLLPMVIDWDKDGDTDLILQSIGVPSPGSYLFLNRGDRTFDRGRYIGMSGRSSVCDLNGDGEADAIHWSEKRKGYYDNIRQNGFEKWVEVDIQDDYYHGRFTYWVATDWNGDGKLDILAGVSDWREYGWDGGFTANGGWKAGPLHGTVYVHLNLGTATKPRFGKGRAIHAGDRIIDTYGMPTPCPADWDGDGDLDLVVGNFVNWMTYYENEGSGSDPKMSTERSPRFEDGTPVRLNHCVMQIVVDDWDEDGDPDLVIGEEDGMLSWLERVGVRDGAPVFKRQVYIHGWNVPVRGGALTVTNLVDWDGDEDLDLIVGNVQGSMELFSNVGTKGAYQFNREAWLEAGGKPWVIKAGENGSIQGPAEAMWGYTAPHVADWDGDGLLDVVTNSIWGEVIWARNEGTKTMPKLGAPQPMDVAWPSFPAKPKWLWWNPKGGQLVTQWRTRPFVTDWNGDGLADLVLLDQEGYLAFWERFRDGEKVRLKAPNRIFVDKKGESIRLNPRESGGSGRVKIELCDWDGDGDLDVLVNRPRADKTISWFEQTGRGKDRVVLESRGPICDRNFSGHTASVSAFDGTGDGRLDLLVGAEDGHFYVFDRHYIEDPGQYQARIRSGR